MENLEITLERTAKRKGYTIGRLMVDGKYFCDTLEPEWRCLTSELGGLDRRLKVKGKTAIPEGRYWLYYSWSVSLRMYALRLSHVPLFEGVLIHPGNYPRDTQGCILVGQNNVVGEVHDSWRYFGQLRQQVYLAEKAGRKAYITVR